MVPWNAHRLSGRTALARSEARIDAPPGGWRWWNDHGGTSIQAQLLFRGEKERLVAVWIPAGWSHCPAHPRRATPDGPDRRVRSDRLGFYRPHVGLARLRGNGSRVAFICVVLENGAICSEFPAPTAGPAVRIHCRLSQCPGPAAPISAAAARGPMPRRHCETALCAHHIVVVAITFYLGNYFFSESHT